MISSRPEFIELCGITQAYYSMYKKRGKIIESIGDDGEIYVDTDIPQNKDFLQKRVNQQPKQKEPKKESGVVKKSKPVMKSVNSPAKDNGETNSGEHNDLGSRYALELRKLQAEIDQKEVLIELNKQKLATIVGNNVPISIVKEMFAQLAKQLLTGYNAYIEQEINNFCHKNKIYDSDRVKLLSKMTTGLNNTHSKSVNDARSTMKSRLTKNKITDALNDDSDDD